ncbi:MAG: hypothetical protein ACW99A_02955 [Candidatus Kariarchaeaceae archaeon]
MKNFPNAKNCRSCLKDLGKRPVNDAALFIEAERKQIPNPTLFELPEDYVETKSYWQRVKGIILERDPNVIKEIGSRENLQSEATYSLALILTVMSLITIVDWAINPEVEISSIKLLLIPILYTFSFGFFSIFLAIYFSRLTTGTTQLVHRNFIYRPIVYAFSIRLLETIILLILTITHNNLTFGLLFIALSIYEFVLFGMIISKLLDRSLLIGLITIFSSYLIARSLAILLTNGYLVVFEAIF